MAEHNITGEIGENVAAEWLLRKGHHIIERNFRKKWGEIDIISRGTSQILHFIEVKTVSYETKDDLEYAISHETWRPEEKVHKEKLRRLFNTIETWLLEHKSEEKWQFDVMVVRIVPRETYAKVKYLENIVIN